MACFARPDAPNPPFVAGCFAPGEGVTLRPRLDWGIESEAQMKALRLPEGVDLQVLSAAEASRVVQQSIDAKAVQQHKFERMILEWSLTYEDGTPAPLTAEMIAQLPKGYADAIAAEIERRGGAIAAAQQTGPEGDPTTPRSTSRSGDSSSIELVHSSGAKSQRHVSSAS